MGRRRKKKKQSGPACAKCGAVCAWERTSSGRWSLMDRGGGPHWKTCQATLELRHAMGRQRALELDGVSRIRREP